MDRSGKVCCADRVAGRLEKTATGFRFTYDPAYLADPESRPVSATLPKRIEPYSSTTLFPFFFGLLAEGSLKDVQCRTLKLDENDHFGRLLKTAAVDTIGDVTVVEEQDA